MLVHRFSGVLSAYGIALADSVAEAQESSGLTVNDGENGKGREKRWLILEII